jgi:predicted amidohydrolase YtcJ
MTNKRWAAVVGGGIVAAVVLGGCSSKSQEPFKDAPVSGRNQASAEVLTMPDGFSNLAEKCDGHGNRVIVAFHGDGSYAALTAIRDPGCG